MVIRPPKLKSAYLQGIGDTCQVKRVRKSGRKWNEDSFNQKIMTLVNCMKIRNLTKMRSCYGHIIAQMRKNCYKRGHLERYDYIEDAVARSI